MKTALPLLFLLLASCTAGIPAAGAGDGALPTGAALSPDGYLTIGEVPPSPFPVDPPPMPTALDTFARQTALGSESDRAAAWDNANGPADFQAEVQRVLPALRENGPDNFVDARLVRDPTARMELFFTHDAEATLARYTTDPRFVARTGGVPLRTLQPLMETWNERLRAEDIFASGSLDAIAGKVELHPGITERRFEALASRNDWPEPDPRVAFVFETEPPPPFADPALERLVRAFARESSWSGIQLTALGTGRVVLEDGCFRLQRRDGEGGEAPLVMFGRDTQLALDTQGYLIVRSPGDHGDYRIGETGAWGGPNGVVESDPDVRALRRACGDGEIVNIRHPQSYRLFSLPYPLWVLDYAYTEEITYDEAWEEVIACMRREERRGRDGIDMRDACIDQYNGWDYTGEELPPPPGG